MPGTRNNSLGARLVRHLSALLIITVIGWILAALLFFTVLKGGASGPAASITMPAANPAPNRMYGEDEVTPLDEQVATPIELEKQQAWKAVLE